MKITLSIAALIGSAVVAHANPGMELKNCVMETTVNRVLNETRWMAEIVRSDPSTRTLFTSGLLEGLNLITEEEWTEMAAEDLSPLRNAPASMLIERWMYDAMADCNQATY